ncbi:hypothetical protein BD779DRAFT_1244468 [Infundibulicybe gibba]|nr:hypothetical protein BD779DRAFT_1244468 [Infundibulicybe gibba]
MTLKINGTPPNLLANSGLAYNNRSALLNRDTSFLNDLPTHETRTCPPFSKLELRGALRGVQTPYSAPGLDHITWTHLKILFHNNTFATNALQLFGAIVGTGFWPPQFKESLSVVIPRPKKLDYSLITTRHSIFHPSQFGGHLASFTDGFCTLPIVASPLISVQETQISLKPLDRPSQNCGVQPSVFETSRIVIPRHQNQKSLICPHAFPQRRQPTQPSRT